MYVCVYNISTYIKKIVTLDTKQYSVKSMLDFSGKQNTPHEKQRVRGGIFCARIIFKSWLTKGERLIFKRIVIFMELFSLWWSLGDNPKTTSTLYCLYYLFFFTLNFGIFIRPFSPPPYNMAYYATQYTYRDKHFNLQVCRPFTYLNISHSRFGIWRKARVSTRVSLVQIDVPVYSRIKMDLKKLGFSTVFNGT